MIIIVFVLKINFDFTMQENWYYTHNCSAPLTVLGEILLHSVSVETE